MRLGRCVTVDDLRLAHQPIVLKAISSLDFPRIDFYILGILTAVVVQTGTGVGVALMQLVARFQADTEDIDACPAPR